MSNRKIALTQLMAIATKSLKKIFLNILNRWVFYQKLQGSWAAFLVATQPTSLVFRSSCVGTHCGSCAPHVGQSQAQGWKQKEGLAALSQHSAPVAAWSRPAGHQAFTGSLQQPSPLCRTPALGWEPCLFLLCGVHTSTLCLAGCHAQFWLSCHSSPSVLHMVAQRPTRCTMADQYPASDRCSTFIPHYPHLSANTNISESLD